MTVSVAMCTYNGALYLSKQLESIICQTKRVDEIIICDDGSKDQTCVIITAFIKQNPQIKFQRNKLNLGFVRNFEQAISLCSGDIIFLADQDDIWMPDKVEMICDFFEQHPDKDFVFTNAKLINNLDVECYNQTMFDAVGMNSRNKELLDRGCAYDVIGVSSRITGATVALRSSFVPYCIPFPKTWTASVHDEMIAVSAVLRGKIAYIDKCLIKYRLHDNQTTSDGLAILFKYPVKRIELARHTIFWHESVSEIDNNYGLDKLQNVYKRFWIRYRHFSLIFFIIMLLSGEYSKFHKNPFMVFIHDVNGIWIRIVDRLRRKLLKERI